MTAPTQELLAYYATKKPLVCELEAKPYLCEFWPKEELLKYNLEYEVALHAPDYFGFATTGGGEMFAISPSGSVVCLPFVGMEPAVALPIAPSWAAFEELLKGAL